MSISTNVEGIGHLLSDRLLAIPDYQRAYSWKRDDEVEELWRDLDEAISSGTSEYFLGSIVTTQIKGDERIQVIDGQQRLATVSLIYASIRDLLDARADERAREIEREVLGKRDIKTRDIKPRLVLNAEDNDFFQRITMESTANRELNPTLQSHRLLIDSYNFFKNKLNHLIADLGPDEWQAPLLDWYTYLLHQAKVIEVAVTEEARAFVIFETLNDRGLNLSTSDLLKNYLFGKAGTRVEEVKTRWQRAMSPFTASDLDADTFLRHFWASKKGVVRVKALYSQMKLEITSEQSAVDFSGELAVCSPLWVAMFDRDSEIWNNYKQSARAALDTLKSLSVEQCRPLLLAAMRRFAPDQLEELVSLVISWSVRWSVVGGGSAGTVERLYAQAAKSITNNEIADARGVVAKFGAVPGDLDFKASFETLTVKKSWLARYFLAVLERQKRGEEEPELVPNENVDEVNLEHILPKNPTPADWRQFSQEEIQTYQYWLGNQALLRKSHNRQIGNRPFTEKKPILLASNLLLTKDIGEQDDWTPETVRSRQEKLAELAVRVWRKA